MSNLISKTLGLALVSAALLATGQTAKADPTFATTATFNSGNPLVLGGAGGTLTATGVGPVTVDAPVVTDLATFQFAGLSAGTSTIPAGTTVSITLTQTSPAAPAVVITGSVTDSGNLSADSGFASITFATTSFTLAGITYNLVNLTGGNTLLLDPTISGGVTRLSAQIVPEPSSIIMAGIGMVGMAGYGLRRRRLARA